MKSNTKKLSFITSIGYLSFAIVFFLVPIILISPDSRSDYFWIKILWAEFLLLLMWMTIGGFLFTVVVEKYPRIAGVLPSLSIVIGIYSLLSISVMILSSFLPDTNFYWKFHLIFQLIISAIAISITCFLSITPITAGTGSMSIDNSISPPDYLAIQLRNLIRMVKAGKDSDSIKKVIKTMNVLTEKLQFSLPSGIVVRHEYQDFSSSLIDFIKEYEQTPLESFNEEELDKINRTLTLFSNQVEMIKLKLKK